MADKRRVARGVGAAAAKSAGGGGHRLSLSCVPRRKMGDIWRGGRQTGVLFSVWWAYGEMDKHGACHCLFLPSLDIYTPLLFGDDGTACRWALTPGVW